MRYETWKKLGKKISLKPFRLSSIRILRAARGLVDDQDVRATKPLPLDSICLFCITEFSSMHNVDLTPFVLFSFLITHVLHAVHLFCKT